MRLEAIKYFYLELIFTSQLYDSIIDLLYKGVKDHLALLSLLITKHYYKQVYIHFIALNNISNTSLVKIQNISIMEYNDLKGIDLAKHTKKDRLIYFPASIYCPFSKEIKIALYKYN